MTNAFENLRLEMSATELIGAVPTETMKEIVHRLTKGILDDTKLGYRIEEEKRVIDMRKDPRHEAWMEQR